ncbi:MAG: lipoprotein-releasing system ATP-binding protein LolD [Candidatus Marinimicrobia bacterium]|nr:lipoprotein-releasing system ATP-binding protein LolD [Candidatus Neomarinimicrobiota bacterium]
MILEASNINKSFINGANKLNVLTDLSLKLEEGKIITIMGQSGVGKSTLLSILGTLDSPDTGLIKINGRNVEKLNEDELCLLRNKELGFIFQFHHLLPEFTALENILMPSWISNNENVSNNHALDLLSKVDLIDRKDHYPNQLSGGERCRVAVLRAIINKPSLVMADEPTGNLDLKNSEKLIDLLVEINKNFGQSIVMTTHNPEVANIGDYRLVLNDGKLKPYK